MLEHGGNTQALTSHEKAVMFKGLSKNSDHQTTRAAPLSYNHVVTITRFIDSVSCLPLAIKPCVLIGYSCYLEASNLLSPSGSTWGGAHTLLARDIVRIGNSLTVTLNSTKTLSSPVTL